MIPLQKLVVSLDEVEARLYRDCCYSISEVNFSTGGATVWDYKTVEDSWAFANNWNLLKGNPHSFDQTFGHMENWVRRVGQGYRERDVLLGKREEVDRYIVNLIHEMRSKVTKRILRENAIERAEEEQEAENEKQASNGQMKEEKDHLLPYATQFSSNFSGFELRDHQNHEDAFSNAAKPTNPFEQGPRPPALNFDLQPVETALSQRHETAANNTGPSHHDNKPTWRLQGTHLPQPSEATPAKGLLLLESDSEESGSPTKALKPKTPEAVSGLMEVDMPASPVPSITFSDLEHAPSFIL